MKIIPYLECRSLQKVTVVGRSVVWGLVRAACWLGRKVSVCLGPRKNNDGFEQILRDNTDNIKRIVEAYFPEKSIGETPFSGVYLIKRAAPFTTRPKLVKANLVKKVHEQDLKSVKAIVRKSFSNDPELLALIEEDNILSDISRSLIRNIKFKYPDANGVELAEIATDEVAGENRGQYVAQANNWVRFV